MTDDSVFCGADASPRARARELVGLLGGHVSRPLELDLDDPDDTTLGRWLIASALLGGRQGDAVAQAACRELARSGLLDPKSLAASDPLRVEDCLERARLRQADRAARLLVRLSNALQTRYEGSMERLASTADGLPDLAACVSALAPGFGPAAVMRYLTPLRGWWHVVGDLPASPAVRAASADLGFIADHEDEENTPARLTRMLGSDAAGAPASEDAPSLRDLEAALERLGRKACLRGASSQCPLGTQCPRRT